MVTIPLNLDDDLMEVVSQLDQPAEKAIKNLLVLELYRRGVIGSGRAAREMSLNRDGFIRHAADLGIPYIEMDQEEWKAELEQSRKL